MDIQELGERFAELGERLKDPDTTVADLADAAAEVGLHLQIRLTPLEAEEEDEAGEDENPGTTGMFETWCEGSSLEEIRQSGIRVNVSIPGDPDSESPVSGDIIPTPIADHLQAVIQWLEESEARLGKTWRLYAPGSDEEIPVVLALNNLHLRIRGVEKIDPDGP